jgi:hypothetical protein
MLVVGASKLAIDIVLEEDVDSERGTTSDDTFATRQRELLTTRFSFGESKREMERVEMAMAATSPSSLCR